MKLEVNPGGFNQLDSLSDSLISLSKWAHRDKSNYPCNPCTDSLLKKEIKRQQMNKKTDWNSIISEYKLEMCSGNYRARNSEKC